MAQTSTKQLADHAHKMEEHAEALATGMAELGADQGLIDTFKQCAQIARKAVRVLPAAPGTQPAPADAAADAPAPEEQGYTMESAARETAAEVARPAPAA